MIEPHPAGQGCHIGRAAVVVRLQIEYLAVLFVQVYVQPHPVVLRLFPVPYFLGHYREMPYLPPQDAHFRSHFRFLLRRLLCLWGLRKERL